MQIILCCFVFSEKEKAVDSAVYSGNLDKLKVLLETREDKNPVTYVGNLGIGWTVLHGAGYFGHVNIIKWFHETFPFEDINPLDSTGI